MIKDNNWNQVLIFTRTKHGANKLTEKLIKAGISAAAIHGNKSQGARTKALKNFKDNSIKILVATDIAAWVTEQLDQGFLYIIGPGSTTAAIMAELGLDNTLLGVDVVRDRQLLLADANEVDLLEIIAEYSDPAKIFVTAIGGQGRSRC